MTPPEHVRIVLRLCAAEGVPFVTAWMRALQSLPRGTPGSRASQERAAWVAALRWSRPSWEAAYQRLGPPSRTRARGSSGEKTAA